MIYGLGSISGGHFNPAVSFAVWLRQRLSAELLWKYVAVQFAGALVASGFLAGIFPDEIAFAALGAPSLGARISATQGLAIEGLITFLLVLSVLFTTRDDNADKAVAGVAIGGTLAALILFAGPLTGAGANPARYLGPALVSGSLGEAFVYLLGPMIGAGIAAFLFAFVDGTANVSEEVSQDSTASPSGLLRRARELFRAGDAEGAATALVPLLSQMDRTGADIGDSIRTLLIVIEEDLGPVRALDDYRHLIHPSPQY
jgi:aquaporin Z